MIEVVKAKKYYNRFKRNQVTAIDNTTLSFPDSGLVAILGNSGCGKTTLLNMIGGLDKPDSGKIFVNGKRMNSIFSGHTDNIRNKNIGYIFQNYHLVDDMTVFDNVAMPLRMLGVRNKAKLKENVYYALEMVGLYRYRNRPATALSGGERQRVGIARAIVKNPGIIIADEPTGNLDSGNSLEVMNIIKAISKEKLVILVTHERNLAEFYADRIIEIVDGKVTDDRINEHDDKLDYRIDNKIYLQDFEKHDELSAEGVNLSVFSDGSSELNVTMVLRNGNLYIQCDGKKTEVVDGDSAIELIDDHYHALSKEEAENAGFDYTKLDPGKKRLRYHSIYNLFTLFINGVKKILNYPVLKKILLLGFVASSMFIMYSVSNVMGVNTVTADQFTQVNKDYLLFKNNGNTVANYLEIENLESVNYVLPGDSKLNFTFDYSNYYYQTNGAQDTITASLSALSILDEDKLVLGRMPEAENEIILDKLIFNDIFFQYGSGSMVGMKTADAYLGKTCKLSGTDMEFTVVGLSDTLSPVVYAQDDVLFKMVMNSSSGGYSYDFEKTGGYSSEDNSAVITPVEDAKGKLEIWYGSWPNKDYEVILPYDYDIYSHWIGEKLQAKVNGVQLTVVGFYHSSSDQDSGYFTNYNTYKYKYLASTSSITICPSDEDAVKAFFLDRNLEVIDTFEVAERDYMESISESVKTASIIGAIVLGISLVEIFLMLRSSFLSRVKEVGTLRAIGLKKSDVYKMFLGEILVITVTTGVVGFSVMGYILKMLTTVSYFCDMYIFDWRVVVISVVIFFVSNIIFGLLPVMFTLGKTPSRILSRTDVD